MARSTYQPIDQLPLYPSEEELAKAILGPKRAHEWATIAKVEEKDGLPRINNLYGGRYRPAVKAFYDRRHRLIEESASTPDEDEGETFHEWKAKRSRSAINATKKRSH